MSYYCSKNIKNRIAQLTQAVRLNKTGKSAFSKYLASLRSDAIRWLHDLRPTLEFKYFPSLSIPLDIQYKYTIYTISTLDILYYTIHTILPWTHYTIQYIQYLPWIYNIHIQYIQYIPWTYYTIQFIQYFLGH